MNINFFDWLRTNIRNTILLGVHDAVDCLGDTDDKAEFQQQLVSFVQSEHAGTSGRSGRGGSAGRSRKKKLGRSLKQIQADASGT